MPHSPDEKAGSKNNNDTADSNQDLFPLSPVGGSHGLFLDNAKCGEKVECKSQQRACQEDPCPESSFIDPLRFRVPGVDPGIDIIPEVRAAALRTDLVEFTVFIAASGAGERDFCVHDKLKEAYIRYRVVFTAAGTESDVF
jgi:hypothetical protein